MNPKKKNALMVVLRNKTVFADATLLCIFSLSKTGEPKIIMFSMTWRQLIGGFDLSVFRNNPEGKNLTGVLMLF
ncbi:MAG: hypothetical protein RI960_182 [Pseudomonadota bacterium]